MNSVPNAELRVAALLPHRARAYHSIVDRIFRRLLDRTPDANDNAYYADRLANRTLTVRQVVRSVSGSDEYFIKKVKNKSGAEQAARQRLAQPICVERHDQAVGG